MDETAAVADLLSNSRQAQQIWARRPVSRRLAVVRQLRYSLARNPDAWAAAIDMPQRPDASESLAAEVIPLADACLFLERNAEKWCAPRRTSRRDRPSWGRGLDVTVYREPLGVVLILGAWNYPLFLSGVQALQALVAGNAVLLKPGVGAVTVANLLADELQAAGLDEHLLQVLPEDPARARQAMEQGVDKVVLTGSAATGRAVLEQLAATATPSVMELSGCDAVFVLPGADLDRVAQCLAFGLRFNGSSTCIAPRRVFIHAELLPKLREMLVAAIEKIRPTYVQPRAGELASGCVAKAIQNGARMLSPRDWQPWQPGQLFPATVIELASPDEELMRSDIFAPVLSLVAAESMDQALQWNRLCPYALAASVFGPESAARGLALRINAGCVLINDLIVPTADPRVPFGGRGRSGFGVTRGGEGLWEMTQLKTVVHQRSRWLPHLAEPIPELGAVLVDLLRLRHAGAWRDKLRAARSLTRTGLAYQRARKRRPETP